MIFGERMKTTTEDVVYKTKDDEITAQLSRPTESGRYPAVIMIHEIFGLDRFTRKVAKRLAAKGYIVLAPHLFSSRKLSVALTEKNIKEAMSFMMSIPVDRQRDDNYRAAELEKLGGKRKAAVIAVNEVLFVNRPTDLLTEYLSSAVDYLNALDGTNGKIGSVGFCFGGGMSINLGCLGRTDATVIFYGQNPEPIDRIQNVRGAVMGLYGGEDARINSKLNELVNALVTYKKPFTIKVFPGAYHAFFNSSRREHYNEAAAKESWEMVLKFFKSNL